MRGVVESGISETSPKQINSLPGFLVVCGRHTKFRRYANAIYMNCVSLVPSYLPSIFAAIIMIDAHPRWVTWLSACTLYSVTCLSIRLPVVSTHGPRRYPLAPPRRALSFNMAPT